VFVLALLLSTLTRRIRYGSDAEVGHVGSDAARGVASLEADSFPATLSIVSADHRLLGGRALIVSLDAAPADADTGVLLSCLAPDPTEGRSGPGGDPGGLVGQVIELDCDDDDSRVVAGPVQRIVKGGTLTFQRVGPAEGKPVGGMALHPASATLSLEVQGLGQREVRYEGVLEVE
jgi:hypothetical protein